MLQFLSLGAGPDARRIAVLSQEGAGPAVVWLGGFRSDMRATKVEALAAWAAERGRRFVRFDYTGHGESGGRFEESTVSRWLEDALAVVDAHAGERPVLVGSSMGGWIALLAARALLARGPEHAPSGLVLIAPAADFTERLMWAELPEEIRTEILQKGSWMRPSAYSPEPYPITRALIEDGRRHLLLDAPVATGCPVHILQGMQDPDVPWEHALATLERLPGESVQLTLIKDGDHRLSRPEDIEVLVRAVEAIAS